MTVIVTGGAGFIGSHIVDALVRERHNVLVVDNLTTGRLENLSPGATLLNADIHDRAALEEIFQQHRPTFVVHHAAQTDVGRSMREPQYDTEVNIVGSINLIEQSVRFGVQKFLFASTSAVYPEQLHLPVDEEHLVRPLSPYGVSKFAVEQHLYLNHRESSLDYTVFRYGNVYGPRQNPSGESGVVAIFAHQMLSGIQPTIFGDGTKTRDYIHVHDVVKANLLALKGRGDGEVFNLGWGSEVRDIEVFETVRKSLRVDVEPRFAQKRPGETDRICLDSTKARRLLEWMPEVSFESGVLSTVEAYKSRFGSAERLDSRESSVSL
jgi:UDP-glucose 4-epimerase